MLRSPLSSLVSAEIFRADMARLHDFTAIGRGGGFASNVPVIFAPLRGDTSFDARGRCVGFHQRIHHDIGRALRPFIIWPMDLSTARLDLIGALGPERS